MEIWFRFTTMMRCKQSTKFFLMEMASGLGFQMKSKKELLFGMMEQYSKISLTMYGVLTSQIIMELEKTACRCTKILDGMTFLAITDYSTCANLQLLTSKTTKKRKQMKPRRQMKLRRQMKPRKQTKPRRMKKSVTKSTASIK